MQAVIAKQQRSFPQHRIDGKARVEMGKEIAAAGRLELQRLSEGISLDRHEQEVIHPGKMQAGRFAGLRRRREMDEAVLHIDRRAFKSAVLPGFLPKRSRNDLVDDILHGRLSNRLYAGTGIRPCDLPQTGALVHRTSKGQTG